jgi:hypothetical protein
MAQTLDHPIEIFYSGNHIDSQGKKVAVTNAQVEASVQCFNASGKRLPLVAGHPTDDQPAGGYATKLAYNNGRVSVIEVDEVSPFLRAAVNIGELPYRSVKLRLPGHHANRTGNYEFSHIGFLGRSRPALDQLKSAQFSTNDGEIILMADDDKSAEFAEREAAFAVREAELAAKEAKLMAMAKYEPFVEGLVREGKITPTQKTNMVGLFTSLPDEAEFAAADGTKQSGADFLKTFLGALPKQVEYGEVAKTESTGATEAAFKTMGSNCDADSEESEMHDKIVASGVDPTKDPEGYRAAVKKAMAKGGK